MVAVAAHHGLHELVRADLCTTQGLRVCTGGELKFVSWLMVVVKRMLLLLTVWVKS